ncbi:TolC family protein [Flavobacterium sp. MC2016-06]|uniref:TolC family protein n=1 Tax=Flavobacterium sp. MC2016-06 TaxID=2676308 RepID=UPI0012BABE18|nr:TolC family protein [Flavobacterium sp. MC2016-06]MBU3858414.1 TolC family protein [Flavobacterium sp. MC2016-06]
MKIAVIISLLVCSLSSFGQGTQDVKKQWTLEDCFAYAKEKNISIKTAALSKDAASVNYEQSKSSRLPNLNGSASQNLSFGNSIDPITSDYVSQKVNSTSLGISSAVTLYQGSTISNQIKQNKLLVDQNSMFVEEAQNNVILSITEAYIQILYNKEGINVAENNLKASEKEVQRAKLRLDAGTVARKDYTDALSQAATNKYNLIAAQNDLTKQVLILKQLLELGPDQDFEIAIPLESNAAEVIPNKIEVYNTAISKMPEIKASQLNVAVSQKELDIAKGGYLPTLSLSGSLGSGYTNTQDLSFSDQLNLNFNQRVGLSLSVPIFNRNQTKAQVQNAKISIDKAQIDLQTAQKDLYKKIQTAWENATASSEQLVSAQSAKEAAEESYSLAQKKYELGALSTTDLVISQNTYTNTAQNFIQAKYLKILYTQLLAFYQGNEIKI